MKLVKTIAIQLTGKEYTLLRDASELISNIYDKLDEEDCQDDYRLRDAELCILEFLEDTAVEVEWEN